MSATLETHKPLILPPRPGRTGADAYPITRVGYSNEPPLQAIYLVLGAVITVVALAWMAGVGLPALQGRTAKEM